MDSDPGRSPLWPGRSAFHQALCGLHPHRIFPIGPGRECYVQWWGLDFDQFEDTMEGDNFHCEFVAPFAMSLPSKLSFNTVTLHQNYLIAQPHLSMQHVSMHILSLWSFWCLAARQSSWKRWTRVEATSRVAARFGGELERTVARFWGRTREDGGEI